MSVMVLTDASVTIDSVDLSDHVKSVTLNVAADVLEDTAMGDTYKNRVLGLKDWSVDVTFHQDYAAANVDATLWGIFDGGVAVPIVVLPTSAAASATNPSYEGNVVLESYSPVSGSVGELSEVTVPLKGVGALTRNVGA